MLFPHELALTHVDVTHSVVHNDIIHTVGQHVDSCYKTVSAQTACGAQCACPPIARAEFRSRCHTGGSLASDGSASLLQMLTCLLVGPGAPSFSPRLRPILKKCCGNTSSGQIWPKLEDWKYIICDVDSGASHLSSSSGTYRHLHSLRTLLIDRPKKYFLHSTIGFAIMLLCLNQAQI